MRHASAVRPAVTFREARDGDIPDLLAMMRALWEHEGIPFDERHVEAAARAAGGRAVRIEVAEENGGARRLYREAGYVDPRRLFLAKRLAGR